MNNTLSLKQTAETGDLNADLIMRQFELDKMATFMEIKPNSPKLKQSEIAKQLEISSSASQRYGREKNMLSPYRIPPSSNTHTRKQKSSNHTEHDLKMTSNHLRMTSNEPVKKIRNKLKGGDPSNFHISGRNLFGQAFSST